MEITIKRYSRKMTYEDAATVIVALVFLHQNREKYHYA